MRLSFIAFLFPLFFSANAESDEFYELIRYECNQQNNTVSVEYVGAYNEDGKTLFANKTENDWNPWDLIVVSKNSHVEKIKTIRKTCKLTDGMYKISIRPSPCNSNLLGMDGGMMMAGATISKQNNVLISGSFGACQIHDEEMLTTKISIRSGNKSPIVEHMPAKEYFGF